VLDVNGNLLTCAGVSGDWGAPSAGQSDAVLSKLDSQGSLIWIRQWGSFGLDSCHGVGLDRSGNVYAGGYEDFGPYRASVRKFDPSGSQLWVRYLENSSQGHSLAVDSLGNSFITGWGHSVGGPPAGDDDAFLVKFNSAGDRLWSTKLATNQSEIGYGVALDAIGNAYVTGNTRGELGRSKTGNQDVFVAKLDSDGNRIWTTQFGPSVGSISEGTSIVVAQTGDIFVAGTTFRAVSEDAFVAKLHPDGDLLWMTMLAWPAIEFLIHRL
jgi:hypothetical protein